MLGTGVVDLRGKTATWTLAPSDFAFLWEECRRCFYLKVRKRVNRPRTPMPAIFMRIDTLSKRHFGGRRTNELADTLPPGSIRAGDVRVQSEPIIVPGFDANCVLRGRLDGFIEFDNGDYGLLDFKTSQSNESHVPLYGRQLHAYAWALERSAPGFLSLWPVSRLGLLCIEPVDMRSLPGRGPALELEQVWIDCPRDDEAFLHFLSEILEVLDLLDPPTPDPKCLYCRYRHPKDIWRPWEQTIELLTANRGEHREGN